MNPSINENHPSLEHWVGLDVGKEMFDAALLRPGVNAHAPGGLSLLPASSFSRTENGTADFIRWLDAQLGAAAEECMVRCVMESTGRYSTELAVWLLEQRASLAPAIAPSHITAAFITSLGIRTKNDRFSARGLAVYGMERRPNAYAPASALEEELREVCRYRDLLVRQKTAAVNYSQEKTKSAFVNRNKESYVRQLSAKIKRAEAEMKRLVNSDETLKADIGLLCTIYGVAFLTAVTVRAELGDLRRFDKARQLSAYAGLNPSQCESGTSVHRRTVMSKTGRSRIRHALYMPAMAAIRGDNDFRAMYERLCAKGKSHMSALGAVMRKLLCVMRAVLIHNVPYDPNWKRGGKLNHDQA